MDLQIFFIITLGPQLFRGSSGRSQALHNATQDGLDIILPSTTSLAPHHSMERERKVLFNDVLNTFYLRLYGVRHMVKDHSDSEKGNPLPPYRLLLSINSKGSLNAPSHRQDSTYHGLCYTSRGALAGTRNSSMGSPHEGSIRRPIAP